MGQYDFIPPSTKCYMTDHDDFIFSDAHVDHRGLEEGRIRLSNYNGLPVGGELKGGRERPNIEGEVTVLAIELSLAEAEQFSVRLHQDFESLEDF